MHAKLGHIHRSYIKRLLYLGIIYGINTNDINKCEVCAETKQTRKTHLVTQKETELLSLIHTDLGDLKQAETRGGKRYYVTFIDDFSRYTKLYLLRNKDEAFEKFLL